MLHSVTPWIVGFLPIHTEPHRSDKEMGFLLLSSQGGSSIASFCTAVLATNICDHHVLCVTVLPVLFDCTKDASTFSGCPCLYVATICAVWISSLFVTCVLPLRRETTLPPRSCVWSVRMPSKHTNTSPVLSESCHAHLSPIPSHCPILMVYGLRAEDSSSHSHPTAQSFSAGVAWEWTRKTLFFENIAHICLLYIS